MIGELDKTTTLATNLLTLVRVHQGGRLAPLEIDELVEAVVHRWRSTADRDWRVSSSVGTLAGDAERLEVALDCLLETAVKFTGIGDTIAVEACVSGSEMILTVTDAGSGIPAEDLHRVFDIFHTGSAAGDRAGSGLGLAVVRAIVEARGGTVSAASSIGQGSRFTIRAPVGDGGPAALFTADDWPVWPDVLPATGQVTGMPLGRARLDPPAPARNG